MANHTTIRLEAGKKEEFAKLCDSMGLSVPFDITAETDPFYSDANQRFYLNQSLS